VASAAGNRRRAASLTADGPVGALRRAMRAEVALAVLVLAATAVLVREAPPEATATGPAERELDLGPMRLDLVIEPAEVGPNDMHLYFFDRRSGAQVDSVKEVVMRLSQEDKDIGPIRVPIRRKGVAHYELLGQPFGVAGEWKVEVDARVSESDLYTDKTEIEVRKK
jgi:copper transport protein